MIFKERPNDFRPSFRVVGIFIINSDFKSFLLLRRTSGKPQGKTWGAPGGKVNGDRNESISYAVGRECLEETGMKYHVMGYHGYKNVRYPEKDGGYDFEYHVFSAVCQDSVMQVVVLNSEEHDEHRWVTVLDTKKMPLIPDMREIVTTIFPSILEHHHL